MYNIFTQWITLSVIFFLANYMFELLAVVTLGGLTVGSCVIAALVVFAERISRRLPAFTAKGAVAAAVLLGVQALGEVLPGYTVTPSPSLILFAVIYAVSAVIIAS